jgi:hypothetical protein
MGRSSCDMVCIILISFLCHFPVLPLICLRSTFADLEIYIILYLVRTLAGHLPPNRQHLRIPQRLHLLRRLLAWHTRPVIASKPLPSVVGQSGQRMNASIIFELIHISLNLRLIVFFVPPVTNGFASVPTPRIVAFHGMPIGRAV